MSAELNERQAESRAVRHLDDEDDQTGWLMNGEPLREDHQARLLQDKIRTERILLMKVFVLLVQWKDDEPEISGVFSSFDRAVMYFVRMNYQDSGLKGPELRSVCARAALKMARKTDDEDFADFGSARAWVEEEIVDDRCEDFEKEARDDC